MLAAWLETTDHHEQEEVGEYEERPIDWDSPARLVLVHAPDG